MDQHNPDCDGLHCRINQGTVRLLPTAWDKKTGAVMSNRILCESCYGREMQHRKSRNRQLPPDDQFPIPTWAELEIYTGS